MNFYSQLTFPCLKSVIETLEKAVKYVQSWHKKHQNDVNGVILEFLSSTLNVFTPFSSVSIVGFEQVNVS